MGLDKNTVPSNSPEIVFNWERVKKQAASKRNELVCNAPKINRREEIEALKSQTSRLVSCLNQPAADNTCIPDFTTSRATSKSGEDSNTEPLPIPDPNIADPNTSRSNPKSGDMKDIDNKGTYRDIDDIDMDRSINTTNTHSINTTTNSLLARPRPQGEETSHLSLVESPEERSLVVGEKLGPDTNAIDLLTKIKNKELSGKDLQKDERSIVVKALRMNGQTQDSIAAVLGVSRRTIVNDCRELRHMAALEIQNTDTAVIAGEVYEVGRAAMRKALAKGHIKSVSTIMKDMVELLQSMGMVYRAPKTSMQATMHGQMNGQKGYEKYMQTIGDDTDGVVHVLDRMFDAISTSKS
jgi:DNA-binding CsgD family transcriptional regulator